MSQLSDDESSDSSDDFLVPAEKIDLDSTFFKTSSIKNSAKSTLEEQPSSDDSDDDLDYSNDNVSSAELLAQVLKNFENAKAQTLIPNDNQPGTSTDQAPSVNQADDLSKEIHDLLLQGESQTTPSKKDSGKKTEPKDVETEVKSNYTIPETGIQIHLPGQNLMLEKKKKKQRDLQKLLQNKINQRIRTTQVFVHKVGLLTWLSHGFFLNKFANDAELLATALSLISPSNYPKGRPDLKYIEQFTKWFSGKFLICEKHKEGTFSKDSLLKRVSEKKIYNYVELVLLYIATVRGMGINCRLVMSLQPPRLKPKPDELLKIPDGEDKKDEKNKPAKKTAAKRTSKKPVKNKKSSSKEKSVSPTKIVPENSREVVNLQAKSKAAAILNKSKNAIGTKADNIQKEDGNCSDDKKNLSISEKLSLSIFKRNETKKKIPPISRDDKHDKSSSNKTDKSNNEKTENSGNIGEISDDESDFSTYEDFVDKKPKKSTPKPIQSNKPTTSKAVTKKYNNRKLLSSDEEDDINTLKNTYNVWVEIYVESEESWISVDVIDRKIHCSSELHKKAADPVLYIVAWNSVGTLKDVTRRYCPHWLTDTRKKRVDEKWWTETLSSWKEKRTAMSKAEDEQLLQRELEQPLPKTVGECKGHPLYALTRHLLKFEALHPPDAVPLGYLKTGEAIYSRHCVHTLYSRETWIKKARVVKPGEQAYKIVKAMPKYDKLSGQKIKDQPLEIFGKWQTTPYIPPEAKDGKVPRNEYGNVDLFKMCMLPKGTVYINLPALNRVARKLNIDCAQACVGFNFGGRGALPAFEGYVVCEEYEDTLREAWEEEQIESQKRAKEKREKRIYGNWKKLIKGLFIREKLAIKYNFKGEADTKHFEEEERINSSNKKPAVETKSSKAVADHKEGCQSDTKIERSIDKASTTKKKIKLVDESEEKKSFGNDKVDDFKGETDDTHFEKKEQRNSANKKSPVETKSSEADAGQKEVGQSDSKSTRSKTKATTTKKKITLVEESEEKKPIRNEKVDNIKKNFARRAAKTLKVSSDKDLNGEASGSDLKHDNLNANDNDGIRITRKRAAALKNLVDVNVNEEDSVNELQKKTGTIPKRKLIEKTVDATLKTSKKLKLEQDNSSKKIKR